MTTFDPGSPHGHKIALSLLGLTLILYAVPALSAGIAPDDASNANDSKFINDALLAPADKVLDQARVQTNEVFLEVKINGESTGLITHFRQTQGHLSTTGKDLREIGFKTDVLGVAADTDVDLGKLSDVRYTFDLENQTIDLLIPNELRTPLVLDPRAQTDIAPATSGQGVVVNYDAYLQADRSAPLAMWSEERFFNSFGAFSNTGTAYIPLQRDERNTVTSHRYVRYDTAWSHSDPATNSTFLVGDAISSSLAWSRSIRFGGIQWRSNFSLRPDLVTFPLPSFAGTAVVPSAVELYLNGIRQYSSNVPSGPFVINQVAGITGAGYSQLITRDALGRVMTSSMPLYIDKRLLAAGLSRYAFEAGFLRRRYGIESFDYHSRPAVSGSWQYGFNNHITVEAHGEASSGIYNAGGGTLVRLGQAGVINCAISASTSKFSGKQFSLGYQYVHPRFSVDTQIVRSAGNYGDLAASDGAAATKANDHVTLVLPLLGGQNIAFSYINYKDRFTTTSQMGSVSYSVNLKNRASLNLNIFKDFKNAGVHGISLSLNISLGDRTSLNTSVGQQNGRISYGLDVSSAIPYRGGWGWSAQTATNGDSRIQQAHLQYLGNYGQVTAAAQIINSKTSGSAEINGSLVLMDGVLTAARRINDSFALVSTGKRGEVPVLHQYRQIGVTNSRGYLLVPDLNSYQNNLISIDPNALSLGTRVDTTNLTVVPQSQSGVVVRFGVSRYTAASVILRTINGKPLPLGTALHHIESGKSTVVGYDGIAFIDNLQSENHVVVSNHKLHCSASFTYQAESEKNSLPIIGPVICQNQLGKKQ